MNSKEFDDGLQVEIEISEKAPKSLMSHLPARVPTEGGVGWDPAHPAFGRTGHPPVKRAYIGFSKALYQKFS